MTGGRARAADVMRSVVSVDLLAALRAMISRFRVKKPPKTLVSRALAVPTTVFPLLRSTSDVDAETRTAETGARTHVRALVHQAHVGVPE